MKNFTYSSKYFWWKHPSLPRLRLHAVYSDGQVFSCSFTLPRVSQSWNNWHSVLVITLLWGATLSIVGGWGASPASGCTLGYGRHKCLHGLPKGTLGRKRFLQVTGVDPGSNWHWISSLKAMCWQNSLFRKEVCFSIKKPENWYCS